MPTPRHGRPGGVSIRPSDAADMAAIAAIYARHVEGGTGTFELVAPTAGEMARRRDAVLAGGWPWLVAEVEGGVVGYAYASAFRERPAYRYCAEDSVYVAADAFGRGVGRALLAELLRACEAAGARQMLALIGDSANGASIALHRALGFRDAGLLHAAGWKFERWIDVVLMQRPLGAGSATPVARG